MLAGCVVCSLVSGMPFLAILDVGEYFEPFYLELEFTGKEIKV